MLKDIVIAIQSYLEAHRFIVKHRLWKWIFIPGILYAMLFCTGIYLFWISSGQAGKKVAYPDAVSEAVLKRFGPAPAKGGAKDRYDASVDWSMQVLRDYVLPELRPDLAFVWMTEPDHIQHGLGAGAPEALAAIRNDDRQIGLVLKKLEALGVREKTNIMVV